MTNFYFLVILLYSQKIERLIKTKITSKNFMKMFKLRDFRIYSIMVLRSIVKDYENKMLFYADIHNNRKRKYF